MKEKWRIPSRRVATVFTQVVQKTRVQNTRYVVTTCQHRQAWKGPQHAIKLLIWDAYLLFNPFVTGVQCR